MLIFSILDDLFSSMIKQVHNSLTVHDNLWTLKSDNFSEFQNLISDSPLHPERHYDTLRTKIDKFNSESWKMKNCKKGTRKNTEIKNIVLLHLENSRSSHLELFCQKGVLKNFAKFIRKHLCQRLFFNIVASLRPATILKKRLWHRYFPVNFAKFLRTVFVKEHLWW